MVFLVILSIGALAYLGLKVQRNQTSDRFMGPDTAAPSFSFPDQTGKVLASTDLKGKVWVADFIFTRCAGQCPMLEQWFLSVWTQTMTPCRSCANTRKI
jgi:cytochrome oxidase Cu insertion factor (SCO1/SenC/PrrC family)